MTDTYNADLSEHNFKSRVQMTDIELWWLTLFAPLSVCYFSLCDCPAGTLGLYSLQTGALERGTLEGGCML